MWIVIKLFAVLVTFCYRSFFRHDPKRFELEHNGTPYAYEKSTHKGKRTSHSITTPLDSSFAVHLREEGIIDRWLVSLGIGSELQVGDRVFDQKIFIVSDNQAVSEYLGKASELRELICTTVPGAVKSITLTGKILRLDIPKDNEVSDVLELFERTLKGMKEVAQQASSSADREIYRRALIAEGVGWSIFIYGILGVIEYINRDNELCLFPWPLILSGLIFSLVLTAAGVYLLRKYLGRSSRVTNILVEGTLLLVIGMPIFGVTVLAEVNFKLDPEPGVWIERTVTDTKVVHRRSRKGGSRTSYYLYFNPDKVALPSRVVDLPLTLKVPYRLFARASNSRKVSLLISNGLLGFPWYRELR